jgi:hypothetical protein
VRGGSCGVPAGCGSVGDYAACFDELFSRLAQRRGFREYLTGPLTPRDRNKMLTDLAGSEPVTGAQHAAVQRLQYSPQSTWDADANSQRRLVLLVNDPVSALHARGMIAIEDFGDRMDGTDARTFTRLDAASRIEPRPGLIGHLT